MQQRHVGILLIGIGLILVVGAILTKGASDDGDQIAGESMAESDGADQLNENLTTTTTSPSTTSTNTEAPTTTTTTEAPTTTTTTEAPTTTTSLDPESSIESFLEEFAAAIARKDVDWLFERLNGSMILGYGEDTCRSFIENEILLLEQYELNGAITGPATKTLATGVGEVSIDNIYSAETRFVFQGSPFDSRADFVMADPITWLATCR